MKEIHIGSIIKQKVLESPMTIKEFADRINCDRTTVYDLFKRKSIDVEKLIRISHVLDYNFIEEVYFKSSKIAKLESQSVFIAIEINKHEIENLNLSDEFQRFIKLH